jgi:hypothetical protein
VARQPLYADIDGFSLHGVMRAEAHDRKRLEQLCRHITRPALSDERVQLNAAGQVKLKLKTPWRDGTTHLVMSPPGHVQTAAGGADLSATTAHSNDRFAAINLGSRTPGLGRLRVPSYSISSPNCYPLWAPA